MTNKVFIDTGFMIGLISKKDQYHHEAKRILKSGVLKDKRLVTSEMVLTELLNAFSDKGKELRVMALRYVNKLISSQEVHHQNHELFEEAKKYYADRPDKEWGLTDCASFLIMERNDIKTALSFDKHFIQARYTNIRMQD
jgi:predicted nucleic acid-binding protein